MTRARRKQIEATTPKVRKQLAQEQESGVPVPPGIYDALRTKSELQKEIKERFNFPAVATLEVKENEWVILLRCAHKPGFTTYKGVKVFWLRAHGVAAAEPQH